MATLDEKITRVENNIAASLEAAAEMGAEVPEGANSNNLPNLIRSIPKGGGASSWNDLTDKPFGEETVVLGDTLAWDGNTEGLTNVLGVFYKISEQVPTIEDFANGCTVKFFTPEGEFEEAYTAESFVEDPEGLIFFGDGGFVVVGDAALGVDIDGLVFQETGLYLMNQGGVAWVSSITIPGYTFAKTELKTIEPKYLPEHLQFGEGPSDNADTLTWDGGTGDLVANSVYYKVSDAIITAADLENGITFEFAGSTIEMSGDEVIATGTGDGFFDISEVIRFVPSSNYTTQDNVTFPDPGVYFARVDAMWSAWLTIHGYNGFSHRTVVHLMEQRYLPEQLQFGDFASGGNTLNWDGNTEGLEKFEGLYKVSDVAFSIEDAASGIMVSFDDGTSVGTNSSFSVHEISTINGAHLIYLDGKAILASLPVVAAEVFGCSVGTYFNVFQRNGSTWRVKSITLPGSAPFPVFKPLDKKYLPGDLIPAYTATDEGKVLKIVNGAPAWVPIPSAEEASF